MALSKETSRMWLASLARAWVISTRWARNMLLLSRMAHPLSFTVANVSKPSKTRTILEPGSTSGF